MIESKHLSVFISYSYVDSELAFSISSMLAKHGIKHFLDKKDISLGNGIKEVVDEGLRLSTHVIVIISPASTKSIWVPYEVGNANALRKCIIPILAHPSIEPPEYLRQFLWAKNINELEAYFFDTITGKSRPRLPERPLLWPSDVSEFLAFDDYRAGRFTPNMDADGFKDLNISILIGNDAPHYISSIFIRPVRVSGFEQMLREGAKKISIRMGRLPDGRERAQAPIPSESDTVIIEFPLVSEHGWYPGETKIFYAACGPVFQPAKFKSAPLAVKRQTDPN